MHCFSFAYWKIYWQPSPNSQVHCIHKFNLIVHVRLVPIDCKDSYLLLININIGRHVSGVRTMQFRYWSSARTWGRWRHSFRPGAATPKIQTTFSPSLTREWSLLPTSASNMWCWKSLVRPLRIFNQTYEYVAETNGDSVGSEEW